MLSWGQAAFEDCGTYILTPVGLTCGLHKLVDTDFGLEMGQMAISLLRTFDGFPLTKVEWKAVERLKQGNRHSSHLKYNDCVYELV